MVVTRRFRVFPLYQQVEIRDATDDVDRPLWETGEERVLAAAQCIVLAAPTSTARSRSRSASVLTWMIRRAGSRC